MPWPTGKGRRQRANGGTLFLDEICEMEPALQTKLLRFIQTGTFQKVGGTKLDKVDLRYCAPPTATRCARWRKAVSARTCTTGCTSSRSTLPPLREREDDVLSIAQQFLVDYAEEEGKSFNRFHPDVEQVFRAYSWPGNVRQLQNVIRNVVVLHDGEQVTLSMLPSPLNQSAQSRTRQRRPLACLGFKPWGGGWSMATASASTPHRVWRCDVQPAAPEPRRSVHSGRLKGSHRRGYRRLRRQYPRARRHCWKSACQLFIANGRYGAGRDALESNISI